MPAAGFPSATAASPVFTSKFLSTLANLMLPDHPVQEPREALQYPKGKIKEEQGKDPRCS